MAIDSFDNVGKHLSDNAQVRHSHVEVVVARVVKDKKEETVKKEDTKLK